MNNSNCCILAVDAGGTFLKAALADTNANIITNSFMKLPIDSDGTACQIRSAYEKLSKLAASNANDRGLQVSAVGVCIPGPFDYHNGVSLMTHKYAAINNLSLSPWISHSFQQVPVHFLHDANSFLLGSLASANLHGCNRIAGVTLGTGLGFATVLDGKVYKNQQGGPGISIYSRPFRDGVSEDYASRRAILRYYGTRCGQLNHELDVLDIAKLARDLLDSSATGAFAEFGTALGQILRPILEENKIDYLVLGGAISKSADLFLPNLAMELSSLPALQHVVPATEIDLAPVRGAAIYACNLNI